MTKSIKRPVMPLSTRACWCDVCENKFLSDTAFDIHRRIAPTTIVRPRSKKPIEDDVRQDGGKCFWPSNELRFHYGSWGTNEDVALAVKMKSIREARSINE